MFYLGIDIGKNTHVASLIDEKAKVIFKAFSFSNSTDGATRLLEKISPYQANLEIGMEATGHYWLSLYSFLIENQFVIHVINPIQTDGWRKGTEIRKRKTDIIDSVLIADFIRYGNFLETSLADEDIMSLRNLSRFRNYLISSIGDLKRKTICVLDQIFPEYASIFSDVFGKTSKEILMQINTPNDFEDISFSQLEKVLEKITFKKFAKDKIDSISKIAKNSFGITLGIDSFSFQLKLLIEQISFIEKQVTDVEKEIKNILTKINSPITTVPGIGDITAATILGEIGDINRFSSGSKLVAYAGIDATVSQSGEYESKINRMSKRGSPYLRKSLFQAAFIASNCDPMFKDYYLHKRAEGQHHKVAVGAVARKLCHVIHAVLKNNSSYEIRNL
ncbi:IS110 family transposase [Clostridium botulinum]|uniref:IS110 family transposase n=3 Tax=Clostridium botulinum TaxID=1491 RepID=A0ABD7CIQ6_CLOBO|nr:IS110 family transposase [Clostridium botulinum]QRI53154.1 IS110 family transposase [Clostridium botulinum]QRI54472.1 IS110 family transposase [Clostridium botulinum]